MASLPLQSTGHSLLPAEMRWPLFGAGVTRKLLLFALLRSTQADVTLFVLRILKTLSKIPGGKKTTLISADQVLLETKPVFQALGIVARDSVFGRFGVTRMELKIGTR